MNASSHADLRFSSITELGSLRKIYSPPEPNLPIYLGLLAGAILLLFWADGFPTWPSAFGVVLLLGLPLAIMTLLWRKWRRTRAAVAVFEQGIAFHDGDRLVPVRWQEITALESFSQFTGGYYHYVCAKGLRLPLPWTLKGLDELWAALKDNAPVEAVSINWKGQRRFEDR